MFTIAILLTLRTLLKRRYPALIAKTDLVAKNYMRPVQRFFTKKLGLLFK